MVLIIRMFCAVCWVQNKRIVLFDTLLKQVEMPELLAILGHEIGHWKLWHTMQGFIISQV
jgi:STE24 endopeptidase